MIARDGACTSIWQDSMEPFAPTNKPEHDKVYDVAIIGGGITGLSTAWLLQKAGKQCIILEAKNIGFGTTGGTTAHLNTVLDTPYHTIAKNFGQDNAKLVAQAAREAIDLIRQNINELGIDCTFREEEGYTFAQTEDQVKDLDEIYKSCQEVGVDIAYTKEIPVPITHLKAIRFEKQAQFHPLQYVYGLAKAFENAGGVIVENTRVRSLEGDDIIKIVNNKTYAARAVVFATHIPIGINLLHLRCIPYRTYAMAVRLKHDTDYPRALVYDSEEPYHYYRTQEIDGIPHLIAGGCDHRTAEEENTEKRFLHLEAHLRKHFEIEEVRYAWSSQYFEPADGIPYIGHLPGHNANTLVATGFGGNGMIYSSVAAITLSKMLTGEETPYTKLFDPNRVKPIAGFVNFIKHNAVVAGEIISKVWPADKLNALVELAPGDSKVVKYDDATIALHKDEHGNLHALHSECTHMKCTIAWNAAENSWDCPCHGARFSITGEVLTGPAATDLETVVLSR
jgi:glycine/D-amino acid oxidase-like deaminating enzyme/nitrite reductase/ring-hydroxylating ferredoxin subunit